MHSGGLASNEVPIVAKKGEGVFTEEQMRALGSGTTLNIANIVDPRVLESYMATPRGRNAFLNFIGDNRQMVRRILK